MRVPLFASLVLLATGCKAPPQAPTRLEELCSYIFAHVGDEAEEDEGAPELVAGVENLQTWLEKSDNLASTVDGYQISNLDQDAVEALDLKNARSVDGLMGAAVATEHRWSPRQLAQTTVVANWGEVANSNYEDYDRDFNRNPSCFPGRDCLELEASSYGRSSWAGLITVESWNDIQFRWVKTEYGWAFVQRSWLTRPAEVSYDDMDVHAQYFLAVVLPDKNGTIRMQATWIEADYGSLPVSEDFAKQQIVSSMQKQGEAIDEWIEEN